MRRFALACCSAACLFGCATVDIYEVPSSAASLASIEENDPRHWGLMDRDFVELVSIDRKRIARDFNKPAPEIRGNQSEHSILLEPGQHQLYARACVHRIKAIINSGWYCAEVVLRLEALPDTHYRLYGEINRKEEFTDFWIALIL